MPLNGKCNFCFQSCSTMFLGTSKTSRQIWRRSGRLVRSLTLHATRSRLTAVGQSLTDAFKTLLYWRHSPHSCATRLGTMLRLIHSHRKLQRCFTWTRLKWRMRFFETTDWHSAEVQGSWTVLELTHRGKVPKHEEMCHLLDCIIWLYLFMWVSLFPHEDH